MLSDTLRVRTKNEHLVFNVIETLGYHHGGGNKQQWVLSCLQSCNNYSNDGHGDYDDVDDEVNHDDDDDDDDDDDNNNNNNDILIM